MSTVIQLHDKKFDIYIKRQEISHAIENMAAKMDIDFQGQTPLFLSVLNGSFLFTADLVRSYIGLCEVSFIKLTSYEGTETTGKVSELIGLKENIKGRTVIILEDIVDTGVTIDKLINMLSPLEPKAIKIATFLFKPKAYQYTHKIDYVGIEIPNDFVVGYGLDYDGIGRNLNDIYKLVTN